MTQPAKVQEPSMEEILASIRRIIADDEAKPPVAADKKPEPVEARGKVSASPEASKLDAGKSDTSNLTSLHGARSDTVFGSAVDAAVKAAPKDDDLDDVAAGQAQAREIMASSSLPEADNDVFELTDDMALAQEPSSDFNRVDPTDDVEFADSHYTREPVQPYEQRKPATESPSMMHHVPPPISPSPEFLSRSTASAVESAFNSLATTVLSNNARTLEDLVREMLRPMLKSWLDDNLPGLVERIVKAEIERVSRGR